MLDLLVFDIHGFMGHFRKIHSTTSSLTYFFPPRTTITGLVAGILGRDRDTYYEEFALEQCKMAVGLNGSIRKLVQPILYLNTDTIDEAHLRGIVKDSHVPIALELLLPEPPLHQLSYRVYMHHKDAKIMDELAERLTTKRYIYPPSLGLTECPATLTLVNRASYELVTSTKSLPICTVIPQSKMVDMVPSTNLRIFREDRVPVAFQAGRHINRIEDFIFEGTGQPFKVTIQGELFKCQLKGGEETYGVFME